MATTSQPHIVPLIDIEDAEGIKQYETGLWWRLYGRQTDGEPDALGPLPDSYLVDNLIRDAQRGYFDGHHSAQLHQSVCFYLGMLHGGVLSPETKQLRPDVTTLVTLHNPHFQEGYHSARHWYFHAQEYDYTPLTTEQQVLRSLTISHQEDNLYLGEETDTLYWVMGCLVGALSCRLFPQTEQEQHTWKEQGCTWDSMVLPSTEPLAIVAPHEA